MICNCSFVADTDKADVDTNPRVDCYYFYCIIKKIYHCFKLLKSNDTYCKCVM